jgi:hypothetical protein
MPISARGMNYGKFEHPMYGSVFKHPVYGYKFKHPKLGFIPINMESHDYDIQSQDEAAHTEGG